MIRHYYPLVREPVDRCLDASVEPTSYWLLCIYLNNWVWIVREISSVQRNAVISFTAMKPNVEGVVNMVEKPSFTRKSPVMLAP